MYLFGLTCPLQTLWLLATHPEVQDKLRAEVTPILAQHPNPDFRTLKGMEYLNQVVCVSAHVFMAALNEVNLPYRLVQHGRSEGLPARSYDIPTGEKERLYRWSMGSQRNILLYRCM